MNCNNNNCCLIKFFPYIGNKTKFKNKFNNIKAGIFIYDEKQKKVLLVQSRGRLWGPPKGSKKYCETIKECAVREVREETGLSIPIDLLTKSILVLKKCTYFYIEMDVCNVNIQHDVENNDVNSVAWIHIDCLGNFIRNGQISLTQHCRIVFKEFLNKTFPTSTFIFKRKLSF